MTYDKQVIALFLILVGVLCLALAVHICQHPQSPDLFEVIKWTQEK